MPHTKDSSSNRLYEALIVSSLFTCGFAFYLSIFLKDPLVPMIDGPYYLIQVKSILLDGKLAYGDPPLTFYLFSIFAILLGDIIFGVKVGASFFSALTTIPAYFLMKRAPRLSPIRVLLNSINPRGFCIPFSHQIPLSLRFKSMKAGFQRYKTDDLISSIALSSDRKRATVRSKII